MLSTCMCAKSGTVKKIIYILSLFLTCRGNLRADDIWGISPPHFNRTARLKRVLIGLLATGQAKWPVPPNRRPGAEANRCRDTAGAGGYLTIRG